MCKCEVISGPYFPVFSLNIGKYGPETTPYLDNFHAVVIHTDIQTLLRWVNIPSPCRSICPSPCRSICPSPCRSSFSKRFYGVLKKFHNVSIKAYVLKSLFSMKLQHEWLLLSMCQVYLTTNVF